MKCVVIAIVHIDPMHLIVQTVGDGVPCPIDQADGRHLRQLVGIARQNLMQRRLILGDRFESAAFDLAQGAQQETVGLADGAVGMLGKRGGGAARIEIGLLQREAVILVD